ncbi:hypothetical protein [Enterococcus phage EFA-1]|nr:hypothetical protein [Enterococcus phage EFA1]
MLGDFILWCKEALRENFCIHDYEPFGAYKSYNVGAHEKCKKCGRLK